MAGSIDNDEQEKPLDPAVERVRRKLVRFVAINLGLLFVALMAVVVAIVYRANSIEEPQSAATPEMAGALPVEAVEAQIALPAGTRVIGHALSGNRMSLHVELVDGQTAIYVYETGEGRMVGRFSITGTR